MAYGDDVIRLRRENASLRRQLGEKVAPNNDDLFGREQNIGAKEFEKLKEEQAVLMRRLAMDEHRQYARNNAMRNVEESWDRENQRTKPVVTAKEARKPDNSDLFVDEETFRRTGGM